MKRFYASSDKRKARSDPKVSSLFQPITRRARVHWATTMLLRLIARSASLSIGSRASVSLAWIDTLRILPYGLEMVRTHCLTALLSAIR
ncbi:protein of unknown function [Agreia sp. COWG]|nr:protein of unknown function [Agreia sp. COWG]